MKILFVGTLPPHAGGSAIHAAQLLPKLSSLGCSIHAVSPIDSVGMASNDVFASRHPDIDLTRYRVRYLESSVDGAAGEEYRIDERSQFRKLLPGLIGRYRPDLIVLGRESFAWTVPEIVVPYSIPTVLLVHGVRTMAMVVASSPRRDAERLLKRFRMIDHFIAVAEHLAEDLRSLDFTNIPVIPNPVDLDRFMPRPKNDRLLRKLSIPENSVIALHASKLASVKRPIDLLESARYALRQFPKLVYVVAGDGPCQKAMVEFCCKAGILEAFRFTGWVDHAEMPDFINLADFVILPSEAEGQALVYLETQACGKLIVASDIPAAREVIVDDETGFLFPKGNIEALTAKTILAASKPELRELIGMTSHGRVQQHSLDIAAEQYMQTFESIVGDRPM